MIAAKYPSDWKAYQTKKVQLIFACLIGHALSTNNKEYFKLLIKFFENIEQRTYDSGLLPEPAIVFLTDKEVNKIKALMNKVPEKIKQKKSQIYAIK